MADDRFVVGAPKVGRDPSEGQISGPERLGPPIKGSGAYCSSSLPYGFCALLTDPCSRIRSVRLMRGDDNEVGTAFLGLR